MNTVQIKTEQVAVDALQNLLTDPALAAENVQSVLDYADDLLNRAKEKTKYPSSDIFSMKIKLDIIRENVASGYFTLSCLATLRNLFQTYGV